MQNDIEQQPEEPSSIHNIIKKMLGNKIILIALFIASFIIFIIIIISAISRLLKQSDNQNQVITEDTDKSCIYNGKEYKHGQSFQAVDSCNTCTCKDGEIVCTVIECEEETSQTSTTTTTQSDSSITWTTYEAENYSIKYPKNWNVEKGYSYDYGTIFSDDNKYSLTLTHYSLPDERISKEIDTLEELIAFHYRLESSAYSRRDTTVNNYNAVIIGTTDISTELSTYMVSYYIEKEETDIWLLSAVTNKEEDESKRKEFFQNIDYMVKSLKFKEVEEEED